MIGLAAELSGTRLWMSEAMATFTWVLGTLSYTCSRSKIMYGDQQRTNTETNEILLQESKLHYSKSFKSSMSNGGVHVEAICVVQIQDPHTICVVLIRPL